MGSKMIQSKKTIYKEKNITVITLSGRLSCDQIIDALEDFYNSDFTMNSLWNFSEADLLDLKEDQLNKIISAAKKYAHLRRGGKTAFVTSRDVDYGVVRMFELMSENEPLPRIHYVFNDFDEAMKWLEE